MSLVAETAPIIFIHSLAGRSDHWRQAQQAFSKQRQTYTVDLPGHNGTPPLSGKDLTIVGLARWLDLRVAELGLKQFILVGHSLGSSVAIAYACRFPDKVVALLLVDPSGDASLIPEEQISGLLNALQSPAYSEVINGYWQQILAGGTEATQARVMADLAATPQDVVIDLFRAVVAYRPVPDLKSYTGPRHIFYGPATEVPNGLQQLLPEIETTYFADVSHWLQLDKPEQFNSALSSVIAGLLNQNA